MPSYRGLISTDWNGCLAPCGPFDAIAFHYPALAPELTRIFGRYTANVITLGQAARRVERLMPGPLPPARMDAYLQSAFVTYKGVPELIEWCAREGVLFMVNTTGMIGYFQRALALGLLPSLPALSAHAMVRFAPGASDPAWIYELNETDDKALHTAAMAQKAGVPATAECCPE